MEKTQKHGGTKLTGLCHLTIQSRLAAHQLSNLIANENETSILLVISGLSNVHNSDLFNRSQ